MELNLPDLKKLKTDYRKDNVEGAESSDEFAAAIRYAISLAMENGKVSIAWRVCPLAFCQQPSPIPIYRIMR